MKENKNIWLVLFISLFISFSVYILYPYSEGLCMGMPIWIYMMALLHIIFLGALYLFNKYYWK